MVRFPSGQETEFGGQAAYLMRIFGIDGATVSEKPLENTPDTARLAADAALKSELADYVSANVAAIDLGVYEVPDEFLAKKVISWSTFGSAPRQPSVHAAVRSPRILPASTFRAEPGRIAGSADRAAGQWHLPGLPPGGLDGRLPFHRPRRQDDVAAQPHRGRHLAAFPCRAAAPRSLAARHAAEGASRTASGRCPSRRRRLERPASLDYEPAGMAMPCLMPDDAKRFGGNWPCGGGTVCTPIATATGMRMKLAQCLLPKNSKEMFSGHPCLTGAIATNAGQPFNDRMKITGQFAAFATDYQPHRLQLPAAEDRRAGGLAYRACDDKDRNFAGFKQGKPMPNEICGLVGGKKFDICVATNNFDQCLGGAVNRGNRPACSADHFCREDYMCQSLPPDTPGIDKVKGIGFCSPTYFIFQMRIDNHATPVVMRGEGRRSMGGGTVWW